MSGSGAERSYRLVLADGECFEGEGIGAELPNGFGCGEVVFNTSLSGYQEIITDPSYAGQIIAFTYPHIGNYGTNSTDQQSQAPACGGVVVRELSRTHSSWRAGSGLEGFLLTHDLGGISGIDTRRLTKHIRNHGAMPAAFGSLSAAELHAVAKTAPTTSSVDLVSQVTTKRPFTVAGPNRKVIAYDLGIKSTMISQLSEIATVTVVPAHTPAAEVLDASPDGVFLSNGPGDPLMAGPIIDEVKKLFGRVPIFGICLGHQVLALALGGKTYKMAFGHHGANVPVKDLRSNKVEITSQNHNFAVEAGSVPEVQETHVCLNDEVLEGMRLNDLQIMSVQYHPEAAPGPHDSRYLFREFEELMDARPAYAQATNAQIPGTQSTNAQTTNGKRTPN